MTDIEQRHWRHYFSTAEEEKRAVMSGKSICNIGSVCCCHLWLRDSNSSWISSFPSSLLSYRPFVFAFKLERTFLISLALSAITSNSTVWSKDNAFRLYSSLQRDFPPGMWTLMKEATSNVRLLSIAEKMASAANDGMMILTAIFIVSAMINPKVRCADLPASTSSVRWLRKVGQMRMASDQITVIVWHMHSQLTAWHSDDTQAGSPGTWNPSSSDVICLVRTVQYEFSSCTWRFTRKCSRTNLQLASSNSANPIVTH